jgi:arylformamidase
MKIYDITLPLSELTPVWEGDKDIKINLVSSIKNGDDFNVTKFELGAHAGTHIDAPFHLLNDGVTVDKIPLNKLIGPVQVIKIDDSNQVITKEVLIGSGLKKGIQRLLLKTSNSEYWIKDPHHFHKEFVALDSGAASFLVDEGLILAGIDYFSISPFDDMKTPHQILLQAGIVILENVYLVNVDPGFYNLVCLPINLIGTDGAPVRAILTEE